jgi:7,8-dihydropterin-6-yl-methyl-4-(beta-D-ribofuranosyl)aminobenzene 5'-phosphate synthase
MKVSVLAENSAGRTRCGDCLAEWGLSLCLKLKGLQILFDSGHKGTFLHNASKMGVDLNKTDYIVLSHHHWDHTGGLRFSEFTVKKKLITHPRVLEKVLAEQSLDLVTSFEVTTSTRPLEFMPDIYYLGEIPRQTDFEKGAYQDDPMSDDTAIAIKTAKGTIIVTGCSHAGVCNISEYAKKVTGQNIYAVIGGFHLFEDDPMAIAGSIEYFKREKPKFLLPMHCVDHAAMSEFYSNFKVKKYGAGDIFEIET